MCSYCRSSDVTRSCNAAATITGRERKLEGTELVLCYVDTDLLNFVPPVVNFKDVIEKLRPYSFKWERIGEGLGFVPHELSTIKATPSLFSGAPDSFLSAMLADWLLWAPGDARGSKNFATIESLRKAVDRAGLGLTAQEL